ncbi:MAG: hypothetical protein KDE50_02055 [Caldilineaceae bacterium]|nr:hypothetical protein [Caldilineaceae bacterium]
MTTTPTLWQRRLASMENTLGILMDRYRAESEGSRREQTMEMLFINLFNFARNQFCFFHDGLITKQTVNLLPIVDQPTSEFHHYNIGYPIDDHVLGTTLNQIAEDTVVLQRAAEQRDVSNFNLALEASSNAEQAIYFTLADIDKLTFAGQQMLARYLPAEKSATVVTYFRRSANVRVIPYAPVALIGVPMTAVGLSNGTGVTEDLLAIPHELGHHLYWNGSADGSVERSKRFSQTIPPLLHGSPVAHWAEELFCDVIGCIVGGPATARSFLEMQLTEIGSHFTDSRGSHPTPELRPYVYAQILEMMGLTTSASSVRHKWDSVLEERRVYADRTMLFAANTAVEQIIGQLTSDPFSLVNERQWSVDLSYEELYENFAERVAGFIQATSIAQIDEPPAFETMQDWRKLGDRLLKSDRLSNLSEQWANQFVSPSEDTSSGTPLEFTPDDWLTVFDFDGWTTEGPRVGHGGGG